MLYKSPCDILKNIWDGIPLKIKVTFSTAFIIGILTHIYMLTNKLPNHDELYHLTGNPDSTDLGRWFLKYASSVSGTFSMPWINGMLAIVFLSVSACFIVDILKISRNSYCVLVAGLVVTMPSVAATFMYMGVADAYILALLLACLAAFITNRYKYGWMFSIVPLVLCLGIYQSYFAVAAGLLIIVLITDILKKTATWQEILFKGSVRFLGMLVASLLIYLLIVQITAAGNFSGYQDADQIGRITLSELVSQIYRSYLSTYRFFLQDNKNFHSSYMPVLFFVTFLMCGVYILLLCKKQKINKEPINLVLLFILLALLPLACNVFYLFNAREVHDLHIYGLVLITVFTLVLADICSTEYNSIAADCTIMTDNQIIKKTSKPVAWFRFINLSSWIIIITIVLSIFDYYIISNQAYLKQHMFYEQSYAQSVILLSRIQEVDDYRGDMEVVLVGRPRLPDNVPEFRQITLTGVRAVQGAEAYMYFLSHYLGTASKIVYLMDGKIYDDDIASIVSKMPRYPDSGSIGVIDDKVYVRFSD